MSSFWNYNYTKYDSNLDIYLQTCFPGLAHAMCCFRMTLTLIYQF